MTDHLTDEKIDRYNSEGFFSPLDIISKQEATEHRKEFEKAEANYKKIITFYPTDILGDDAYYGLAKLYDEHLARPEDAKANYEKVIFDYADSIFYVDARKRYRTLRGDAIN